MICRISRFSLKIRRRRYASCPNTIIFSSPTKIGGESCPHRKKVFVSAGRVLGSVIIDGFVAAIWRVERDKTGATLRVTLFEKQADDILDSIEAEGLALARFIEDDAEDHRVEFAAQD